MRREDLPEISELEEEIDEFITKMRKARDWEEFKMYREMALFNINMIRGLQKRS